MVGDTVVMKKLVTAKPCGLIKRNYSNDYLLYKDKTWIITHK